MSLSTAACWGVGGGGGCGEGGRTGGGGCCGGADGGGVAAESRRCRLLAGASASETTPADADASNTVVLPTFERCANMGQRERPIGCGSAMVCASVDFFGGGEVEAARQQVRLSREVHCCRRWLDVAGLRIAIDRHGLCDRRAWHRKGGPLGIEGHKSQTSKATRGKDARQTRTRYERWLESAMRV